MPCPEDVHAKRTSFSKGAGAEKVELRSDNAWKLPPRYEVKKLLGKGSYGQVAEGFDKVENRKVAIKRIKNLFGELTDCKRILREICILNRLNYKHIVELYEIPAPSDLERFDELYIIMECVDTDLKKLCRDKSITLTPAHVDMLLYNLLLGLHYLHSAGVYHRDLTPGNCLVNKDLTVKICDFGLSRAIGAERKTLTQSPASKSSSKDGDDDERHERELTAHVVTRWYRAPELILLRDRYTEAVDVWSAGCIFAELLTLLPGAKKEDRKPLFPGSSCFPMSPDPEHEGDAKFHTSQANHDQLNVILDVLGSLSEAELEDQDADVKRYLRRFKARKGVGLKSMFAYAEPEEISILEKMLQFKPQKRIDVAEALKQDIFSGNSNSKAPVAKRLVNLEDIEVVEEPDEEFLRKHFCQEIRNFHPHLPKIRGE